MDVSDAELIRRARAGKAGAFDELVTRHADGLYRLARALVTSAQDAEDVVQETYLGAVKGLVRFEGKSTVKTWLTGILIRQARDLCRRRHVRRAGSIEAGGGDVGLGLASPRSDQAVERGLDVTQMLGVLSEEHREILVLRELNGHSYDEIAGLLGVPVGTVESRIYRARQMVRERFAGNLEGKK